MEKLSILYSLLFFLIIAGCGGPVEVDPKTKMMDVPGELELKFTRNVTAARGYDFINGLSLRAIDMRNLEDNTEPNWVIVGVPEGDEEYWMKQLIHYPIVESVRPNTKKVPA